MDIAKDTTSDMSISLILRDIRNITINIIRAMMPIMKDISLDDSSIVEEVCYCSSSNSNSGVTADVALVKESLEKETWDMVKDSKKIMRELTEESISLFKSEEDTEKHIGKLSFLSKVWYGDVYDGIEGLVALKHLEKELGDTLLISNEDSIVKIVCVKLISQSK